MLRLTFFALLLLTINFTSHAAWAGNVLLPKDGAVVNPYAPAAPTHSEAPRVPMQNTEVKPDVVLPTVAPGATNLSAAAASGMNMYTDGGQNFSASSSGGPTLDPTQMKALLAAEKVSSASVQQQLSQLQQSGSQTQEQKIQAQQFANQLKAGQQRQVFLGSGQGSITDLQKIYSPQ